MDPIHKEATHIHYDVGVIALACECSHPGCDVSPVASDDNLHAVGGVRVEQQCFGRKFFHGWGSSGSFSHRQKLVLCNNKVIGTLLPVLPSCN